MIRGLEPNLRRIKLPNREKSLCFPIDVRHRIWKGGTWNELNRTKVYSISKKLNSAKVGSPLYLISSHVVRVKPLHSSLHQKRSPSLKKIPSCASFILYSSTISPSMSSSFTHESSESGYPFQCTRYSFLPRQSLKSLISSTSHRSSSGITGGGLVGSHEGSNSGSLGTYLCNSLAWNTGQTEEYSATGSSSS